MSLRGAKRRSNLLSKQTILFDKVHWLNRRLLAFQDASQSQRALAATLATFSLMNEEIRQRKIILFDGVCNLCNGSVIFILQWEKEPLFQFASIQSEAGGQLLDWCGLPKDFNQAVVLIDRGNISLGSTAALKIGQQLRFPWSFLSHAGFIVPRFLRDWVYKQIAIHRYQWFGKRDVCMVPTSELKARFLF